MGYELDERLQQADTEIETGPQDIIELAHGRGKEELTHSY